MSPRSVLPRRPAPHRFIREPHGERLVPQIAYLAGVHILVGLIWMTLYAHLVARAHRTLTRSDVRRWLERVTGVVLIAFGLRVAVEQR